MANELRDALQAVLELQPKYQSHHSAYMEKRGVLVEKTIPALLRTITGNSEHRDTGFLAEGSNGTGRFNVVPWSRLFLRQYSPSATDGWYVVFLFAGDGSSVYLSLNQGTTEDGGRIKRNPLQIAENARRGRNVLVESNVNAEGLSKTIDLRASDNGLAKGYQHGNVYAVKYSSKVIPDDDTIAKDVVRFLGMLNALYAKTAGRNPPEATPQRPEPPIIEPSRAIELPPPTVPDEIFFADDFFREIVELLRRTKNIILQGPPGVGKTFVAKWLATSLMGSSDNSRLGWAQFHQSYSYEDFVQGYRPNGNGGFTLKNGLFYEFCQRAASDPNRPHVFVVDEINRGNLSRIFGEVLSLIESDKRDTLHVALAYGDGEQFTIPANVYLVGLMNTADRSLAVVDYALRRRFRFVDLEPQFDSPKFDAHLAGKQISPTLRQRIRSTMTDLNARITQDTRNLGRGFEIGHSFFCPSEPVLDEVAWYRSVVTYEIAPLLREYWFDSPSRAEETISGLLNNDTSP